tara:strand:+ start:537 stop:746 length:210 start_codon:yes stop_codon:yes gene_type:complete
MKITKQQLKQIIKEELESLLAEEEVITEDETAESICDKRITKQLEDGTIKDSEAAAKRQECVDRQKGSM